MKYKTYTMEDALEAIIDYRGKTPLLLLKVVL